MAKASLTGIDEKIKRSNEHIRNLDAEITTYLDGADHTLTATVKYDASKGGHVRDWVVSGSKLPPRLSVIIGEVVHQLRSSLDHLVWQLVIANDTEKTTNDLEFPVLWESSKYPARARRKIKGVSSTAAKRIEALQPYNAISNVEKRFAGKLIMPLMHPLWMMFLRISPSALPRNSTPRGRITAPLPVLLRERRMCSRNAKSPLFAGGIPYPVKRSY